jgi:hypothetical protein
MVKVEDFIDLRFVDEIRKSGFPARLSVKVSSSLLHALVEEVIKL